MNLNPAKFFKNFLFYSRRGGSGFIVLLALFIALAVVNAVFAPGILALADLILFLVTLVYLTASYQKILKASFENKTKNLELESVIQNIKDGILVYDSNSTILDANKAALEIFGLTKNEMLGLKVEPGMSADPKFKVLTQTVFPSLASSINTVSDSGWPKVVDLTFEDPHLELRTALNQILNDRGEAVGFLKIITDNTRESTILESKSEFLTVSAHQLRTPLTAINWTFESLKSLLGENPAEKKEEVANLINEGWGLSRRSLKIIDDLLDATKIEEGKFGFTFTKVNLVDLMKTLKKSAETIAKEYGIKVSLTSRSDRYEVRADEERLGMAITNILDNAIKYNVKGGAVDILVEEGSPGGGTVKISISDTGIGIPKESLGKIFQKFYRSENAQSVEPNGSGLGMYITKNIIEAHGGKIHVESQIGRGTTFWFTLPLDKGQL